MILEGLTPCRAQALQTTPTANVACLVGTAPNVNSDRTLCGEMALPLGGDRLYRLVTRDDERRTASGTKLLWQLLEEAGPSLILIDETLGYLVQAGQEPGIAVANSQRAVLVAMLTSLTAEHLDEGMGRTLQSLEKVPGRVEKVRTPLERAEVYEVIRRRLFEDLDDPAQHRATAEAYFAMYQKLSADMSGDCVPGEPR